MSPRCLLILYTILIGISATTIDPALNNPNQQHSSQRRLLSTTLYPESTENNVTTTLTQSPLIESTIFYQNTDLESTAPPSQSLPLQLLDNLLHDQIYQIVAVLIVTQTIVFCCLILYCRKQSNSHQQIKALTLKIDGLIANNRYQRTFSQSPASPASPQTTSVNVMTVSSGTNHRPLTAINKTNHQYPQPQSSLTEPQKTITASQSAKDRETPSNNRHPFTPNRPNNTSLPPYMHPSGINTIKPFVPANVIAPHVHVQLQPPPAGARLPNAMYNMPMDRNITATMTPSNSESASDHIHHDIYMNVPTQHRTNDSVWSDDTNVMNVLRNGQSVLSMATVNSVGDSVLGEMLGFNINTKQTSKDVDTILEDDVMEDNASGSYHL